MADDRREEFMQVLKDILGSDNVYFQPPTSTTMRYPCIFFERSNLRTEFANNLPYKTKKRYSVSLIAVDPDDSTFDKLSHLPMSTFDRHYKADNLNHDVFSIYF